MGPHRPFADALFAGMRERSVGSGGRRMLTLDDETWCECPACEGTHLCPTFADAVTRHRMLDAIEQAAATGQRQTPG